jgi:hypothetical protein
LGLDDRPRRRIKGFSQGDIDLNRAGDRPAGGVDRFRDNALKVPLSVRVSIINRELEAGPYVDPVEIGLADRLAILLINPLRGAICGEDEEWNLLVEGFGHGRRIIQAGGAGGADQPYRGAGLLG